MTCTHERIIIRTHERIIIRTQDRITIYSITIILYSIMYTWQNNTVELLCTHERSALYTDSTSVVDSSEYYEWAVSLVPALSCALTLKSTSCKQGNKIEFCITTHACVHGYIHTHSLYTTWTQFPCTVRELMCGELLQINYFSHKVNSTLEGAQQDAYTCTYIYLYTPYGQNTLVLCLYVAHYQFVVYCRTSQLLYLLCHFLCIAIS